MNREHLKHLLRNGLSAVGAYRPVMEIYRACQPSSRRWQRDLRMQAKRQISSQHPVPSEVLSRHPTRRTALLIGHANVDLALLRLPLISGLRICGYGVVVLLQSYCRSIEDAYRDLGVTGFVHLEEYLSTRTHPESRTVLDACTDIEDLLKFEWSGCASGKFSVATFMRHTRRGEIDLQDPRTLEELSGYLSNSMNTAEAMSRIVAVVKPEITSFIDRGYTPDGELFDAALKPGSDALTMNAGHRGGLLMFKRYTPENKDSHPVSLSARSWDRIRAMPWTEKHWRQLHDELATCYATGSWYDEVGTQFDKRQVGSAEFVEMLSLDPKKKIAGIFPHLFWDATFFWGRDLFGNYERWFKEALRAALGNDNLNWIIKIHPANVVKSRRDGHAGESSEIRAIKEVVGELPPHIRILPAEHPVSTFSLFGILDYCVTVRGTVGLECACFGIPVITAGTGRYDRKGFTIDPDAAEEHLGLLRRLQEIPPPDEHQTESARRYAWGLLFARPLSTSCVSFGFNKDDNASMWTRMAESGCANLEQASDVQQVAAWLRDGEEDVLTLEPPQFPEMRLDSAVTDAP